MQPLRKALFFTVAATLAGGCVLPAYEVDDSLGAGGAGGAPLPELPGPPANCDVAGNDDTPMKGIRGGYCIDVHEVTWDKYLAFVAMAPDTSAQSSECSWNDDFAPEAKQGCDAPTENGDTTPVVCVDWCDAKAYCLSLGKRLCGKIGGGPGDTTAFADAASSQWYNACSSGGANTYPYGSTYSASACNTNGSTGASKDTCQPTATGYAGVFDLSGNVAEWEDACIDTGAGGSDRCMLRGGSFKSNAEGAACNTNSSAVRDSRNDIIGFRCCWDPDPA